MAKPKEKRKIIKPKKLTKKKYLGDYTEPEKVYFNNYGEQCNYDEYQFEKEFWNVDGD